MGLSLAREAGTLLVWGRHHLSMFDRGGKRSRQRQFDAGVAAACLADDGSALAVAAGNGTVSWLAPDLTTSWERTITGKPVAAALDSFGKYLAVSESRGGLCIIDRHGRIVTDLQTPRALQHLAFVPAAPYLVGTADFGLVACLDTRGRFAWRDGLVIHVGGLTVSGAGEQIILACFSEGLQRYSLTGTKLVPFSTNEPWQRVGVSFDGRVVLCSGMSSRLWLLDGSTGRLVGLFSLPAPPSALALDPLGQVAYLALADCKLIAVDVRLPDGSPSPTAK